MRLVCYSKAAQQRVECSLVCRNNRYALTRFDPCPCLALGTLMLHRRLHPALRTWGPEVPLAKRSFVYRCCLRFHINCSRTQARASSFAATPRVTGQLKCLRRCLSPVPRIGQVYLL